MFMMSAPKLDAAFITKDASGKKDFSYNKRLENEYNQILDSVSKKVAETLSKYDPANPESVVEMLQFLQDYANHLFDWSANKINKLIYSLNSDDKRQWQQNSKLINKELRYAMERAPIEPLMKQYLLDNVGLIQSIPLKAAKQVQQIVVENLKTGEYRAEGLVDQIMNVGKLTESRAKLIARTEVARMSTGLTKTRSESTGIDWYVWRTSHDARVRGSHHHMDRVVIKWSDPASPEELSRIGKSYGHYHPGEIFNCRCFAQPMIRVDDVSWPAKVYVNGGVVRMNRHQFVKLSVGQIPIAA